MYLSVVLVYCVFLFCYVLFVTEEKIIMKFGEDISQLQNVKSHLNIKKKYNFHLIVKLCRECFYN